MERSRPQKTRLDKVKINLTTKQMTDTNFTNFPDKKCRGQGTNDELRVLLEL